ncbi:hypothetical protein Bca52824_032826 [Brassica carinata]|uniref:Uncharacterized protein n=1 Tax=Brassica carinata TaxID=52824 RepID=A0A8X7SCR5_BRACI|nr:hypothetical protein Bca52824_032826 [Brassica carinata]
MVNLSLIDSDLALSQTLQEQEQAYMKLAMNVGYGDIYKMSLYPTQSLITCGSSATPTPRTTALASCRQ